MKMRKPGASQSGKGDSAAQHGDEQSRPVEDLATLVLCRLPVIAWATDRDLRLTHVDGAALSAHRTAARRLVGRTVGEVCRDVPHVDERLAAHEQALAGAKVTDEFSVGEHAYEAHIEPRRDRAGGVTGCLGVALDVTRRRRAEAEAGAARRQLRATAVELSMTEERERRRVAADLHDRIGQSLSVLRLRMEGMLAGSAAQRQDVEACLDLLDRTIADTRTLIFDVSPPVLYDLGFEAAAEWLVDAFRERRELDVVYENDEQPKPLGETTRVALFRAVRELLENVARHAGAREARLSLARIGPTIRVEVADDGIGFDPSTAGRGASAGFGLFNVRAQVERLGGTVEVASTPGLGTRVTILVELEDDAASRERHS